MLEDLLQGFMAGIVYQGKDTIMRMKTRLFTTLILAGCFTASAQPLDPRTGQPMRPEDNLNRFDAQRSLHLLRQVPMRLEDNLKRFDLTFAGGTPGEFIKAINEQADMKVNVIIPPEFAKEQLPPLEVYNVKLPQLFEAGIVASTRSTNLVSVTHYDGSGRPLYETFEISKGFKTTDAPPTDNSIWSFFVQRPPHPSSRSVPKPVEIRILQLTHLLNDYTIEDVTTAIKTAWGMLGSESAGEPKTGDLSRRLREGTLLSESGADLKFHAETGLLVAKGTKKQLEVMSMVMEQLERWPRIKEEREIAERNSQLERRNSWK